VKPDDYLDHQPVDWQHRGIRWSASLTIAICIGILLWVR